MTGKFSLYAISTVVTKFSALKAAYPPDEVMWVKPLK